ncbi:beta-galactosidase [Granulicella sp. L60]|uniref:beta-galactosidase n=1 Tax=Granulicella sp. L60 TaxID=1641866 RepID=UPI00131A9E52|nr:beta-galactosidase [Granulicella sp. L60]
MKLRVCLSALVLLSSLPMVTQAPLPTAPRKPALLLGAAWYPEQWPESRWDADLDLMEAAHINFVRVGEFAWSTMEPAEGKYQLDWLEHAVRAAERHHIAVVMGTPSAAPPAWLTTKYPETLRTKLDGSKDSHGNRQQFDWSDPKYRELARAVAEKMAERFGHDPNVIGWQIDNEYANESYGASTRVQFQDWLRAKYKTLDNLNARWTTSYWSESYQDWRQIPIEAANGNPGLLLNWRQFVSDTWRSYQKNQLDVIRAHAEPRQTITTNMMGWFDAYDHYTVSQDLDFASWDDYVGTGQLDVVRNSATHDLTRGFLRKNFWVMETQPGFVNWSKDNNALNKGEVRAMAWNAVGHGAEAVEYWQWRSALNGQEQYHGTLVGADGTPVPLYDEVKALGVDFEKAAPVLAGTTVESEVAVLQDYNSRWAINWQRHNQAFDPVESLLSFYGPLRALAGSVDVVSDTAPLGRYKLVVAPALNVLTPEAAKNLEAYVRGGGHLVLGQRSAMKDEDNSLATQRQPGALADLLGARVEQFYALDKTAPIEGQWGAGEDAVWAELIGVRSPETQVVMRYGKSNGWLDGQPAAVTRKVGKGSMTYIGAALDAQTMKAAAKWMMSESGAQGVFAAVPDGVDVAVRSGEGRRVVILTNYAADTQTVALPGEMESVLTGEKVSTVVLKQYDVVVLR